MEKQRVERFQGYCPTQDKWETVEQTYLNVTATGDYSPKYIPGMLFCPYISFKGGSCMYERECPVSNGEWTSDSPDVFIALQFSAPDGKQRTIVDDVVKPVCSELGLNAFVVADVQHNEGIYDKILQSISKSRFVIADLTYNNNGAYYEAGYAKGQGKTVIHACSREWFESNGVHFDVKGLNLIVYEDEADYKQKLKDRIRGTVVIKVERNDNEF